MENNEIRKKTLRVMNTLLNLCGTFETELDNSEFYHSACGHAWMAEDLGLFSFEEAKSFVDAFAAKSFRTHF